MRSFVPPRSGAAVRKSAGRPHRPAVAARPAQASSQYSAGSGARQKQAGPAGPVAGNGLPEGLQSVMEAMSGFSLAEVVVHRNSAEPSRLGAAAFTKGNQIHLAPGQDRHLPHEAWHVVQQAQGRVRPTIQMKGGVLANDDPGLEREADTMGARAAAGANRPPSQRLTQARRAAPGTAPVQCALTTYEEVAASAKGKKFSWAKLRTGTDEKDISKKAAGDGLGAATEAGKALSTRIYWSPVHAKSGEATSMDANILGPDHKLGSVPQDGKDKVWNKRRGQLSLASGGKKYIAGHLLNNNLGGPGDDPRNLTAIPATANTTQSARIEEEVKQLVNNQLYFLRYSVTVDYEEDKASKLPYASKITSLWSHVDDDGQDLKPYKVATITIPSPTSLKGGTAVELAADDTALDVKGAAKARIDRSKDIVLNNDGYIRVAVTVQDDFIASIKALRTDLANAELKVVQSEEGRKDQLKQIEALKAEISATTELFDEAQAELDKTLADLELSEIENESLKKELKKLRMRYDISKRLIADLQEQVEKHKYQIMTLEIQKTGLLVAHGKYMSAPHRAPELPDLINHTAQLLGQMRRAGALIDERLNRGPAAPANKKVGDIKDFKSGDPKDYKK